MLYLAWRNVVRRPGQSLVTVLIVLIATCVVAMSCTVASSLERGIALSRERLGADVMVLPVGASTSASEVLFTAQPINVYLPAHITGSVTAVDGVAAATPQFFTQTVDQSCCSVLGATRVVGIDFTTDFVIRPWVVEDGVDTLGSDRILLGSNAPAVQGDQASILGSVFHVASVLEETGTSVDKTIFMDIDAARTIAAQSPFLSGVWNGIDPFDSVSCVMVKVAAGSDPVEVADAIVAACPGVVAVVASELIAGVSSQFRAVEMIVFVLLTMLVVVAALALAGRFSALAAVRLRELGLLRTLGAGRATTLLSLVLETGAMTLVGAGVGIAVACVGSWLLVDAMHGVFDMPGSAPTVGVYVVAAGVALVFAVGLNAVALALPMAKIARSDPQETIARGDLL